jgi:HEPN domain-containing protein
MSERRTEAARWFRQAVSDLNAARWNREGGFHDTACFLAQQAAEKALKSLLYYLGARRAALLTHSLVVMTQELVPPPEPAAGSSEPAAGATPARHSRDTSAIAALLDEARLLDLHYVPSRYPNGLPGGYPHQFYGPDLSQRAIDAAGRIVAAVTSWYRDGGESVLLEG